MSRRQLPPQLDFLTGYHANPLRNKPSGPVIVRYHPPRGLSYPPIPFETKRHWLCATWNPALPPIAFLTYHQVRIDNGSYVKLRRWAYLNHYGGMMLVNLFPVDTNEITAWREIAHRPEGDKEGQKFLRIMLDGARQAGRMASRMRAHKLAVVTGHMRDGEADMLHQWLMIYRLENKRASLKCLGLTPAGRWGIAVAVTGRKPVDVDALKLATWTPPWTVRERAQARQEHKRRFTPSADIGAEGAPA